MLGVPMALAFKELSNTGRSDGNPDEQPGGWGGQCAEPQHGRLRAVLLRKV